MSNDKIADWARGDASRDPSLGSENSRNLSPSLLATALALLLLSAAAIDFFVNGASVWGAIYQALRLLVFEGPIETPSPVVGVVRFLAPLTTIAAVASSLLSSSEKMRNLPLLWMRDHTVVFGDTDLAATVAAGVDQKLIVVAASASPKVRQAIQGRRRYLIAGAADDRKIIERARLGRALAVFALTDDARLNLEIVDAFASYRNRDREVRCLLDLQSPDLNKLARWAFADDIRDGMWLDVLDVNENASWVLLKSLQTHSVSHRKWHLLIVGGGAFSEACASQAALLQVSQTQANPGLAQRLQLTIVGGSQTTKVLTQALAEREPNRLKVTLRESKTMADLLLEGPDAVLVGETEQTSTLALAVELGDLLKGQPNRPPVFVAVHDARASEPLLRGATELTLVEPATLGSSGGSAICNWQDRVAERLYRDYSGSQTPHETISPEALASNRRPIPVFHRTLAKLGVRVAPAQLSLAYSPLRDADFESMLNELSAREHEDWLGSKLHKGFVPAAMSDGAATQQTNRFMRPWNELSAEDRRRTHELLRNLRRHLRAVGYELFAVEGPPPELKEAELDSLFSSDGSGWFRSSRPVRAVRLAEAARWTTHNGDAMVANVGDWLVSDVDTQWAVNDQAFRASYRPAQGWWEKADTVRAVRVERRVTVTTPEGSASAQPGDWIVQNELGHVWPVPAHRFDETYRRSGEATP